MTIDDMAAHLGYGLSSEQARQLGRSMSGFSRTQNGEVVVSVVRKRFKDKSGNHQSYNVAEYSTCYLAPFEELCKAYGVPKISLWDDVYNLAKIGYDREAPNKTTTSLCFTQT